MTREEIIEQLKNAIELIKQNGKDWFDNRDIPILEACIKALEQEQGTTVSVLPDENGYYPIVCGMCANAESELCEWCSGNKNFVKTTTKIPDFYKKYAEQEPTDEWQNGYNMAWEEAKVFYKKEEPKSPCDLCIFNCKDIFCLNCPARAKGW